MKERKVACTFFGMDALLNPADEGDVVVESISFEEMGCAATGDVNLLATEDNDPGNNVSLEHEGLYSVGGELQGFAVASAAPKQVHLLIVDLQTKLPICQRELRVQNVAELKLIKKKDHFRST